MYELIFCPQTLIFQNEYIRIHPPLIDMQSPSGKQEYMIATTSNVEPGVTNPVFQPAYPYVGPTPLICSCPQVSATVLSITDHSSLNKELADAITSKRNDPLPRMH